MRCLSVRLVLVAALTVGALTAATTAQEGYPVQAVKVQKIKGELFAEGRYRSDDETRSGRASTETDTFLEEGMKLNLDGYIYHPNMIDWYARLQLGLSQQEVELDDGQRKSDGTATGYNFSAKVLKDKPVSLRLFGAMSDRQVDRDFARPFESQRRNEGFELTAGGPFPASLFFEHSTDDRTNDDRTENEQTTLVSFKIADERDPNWLTALSVEHEERDETATFSFAGGGTSTQNLPDEREQVAVTNSWILSPEEHRHRLNGSALLVRRQGIFESETMALNQSLQLNHSRSFATVYGGSYREDQNDQQSEETMTGYAGFRKQIYLSLGINGQVSMTDRQFDTGSEQVMGASLDLDYTKKTPIGAYSSTLNLGWQEDKEQFPTGARRVVGERLTLDGTTPEVLSLNNVVGGTVSVRSADRSQTYFEFVDYTVTTFGSSTEITRIDGGDIGDGDEVSVDYTAAVANDANITTTDFSWSHRIDLSDWPVAVYAEYSRRDESVSGGEDPGNLEADQRWLVGSEARWGEFGFSAEHERREQQLSPSSTTNRLTAGYGHSFARELAVSVSGDYQRIEYDEIESFGLAPEASFLETYNARVVASSRLRRNLMLRVMGNYTNTVGRHESTRTKIGASLDWHVGQTDVSVDASRTMFEQETSDGTTTEITLNLRRKF